MPGTRALDKGQVEWLGNTGDAVWVVDAQQRIILWNHGAEATFGTDAEGVLGKPCYEVLGCIDQRGATVCHPNCRFIAAAQRGKRLEHADLAMVSESLGQPVQAEVSFAWSERGGRLEFLAHLCRRRSGARDKASENERFSSGPALEVHLLGPFRCYRDGHLISSGEWGRQKVKTLFAYLVANHRRWVHKEEIIELLWPQMGLSQALGNFRVTMSRLRHILEPSLSPASESRFVPAQSHVVKFEPLASSWVDSIRFEDLTGRAVAASGSRLLRGEVKRLNEAVLLYKGQFLQDWLYEDWTSAERRRLVDLYARALKTLAGHYETSGNWAAAIEHRERLARLEPWQEDTYYRLMQDHLHLGNPEDAVRQYLTMQDILASELGTQPSPRSSKLYHRILTSFAS